MPRHVAPALFAASALLAGPLFALTEIPADAVKPAAPLAAQPFDLAEVTLGDSPFREAMRRDHAYLLSLDTDRLLHTFRLNVGLASAAQPYGGWEGPEVELRGHSLGHYLSACALMYRSTGDEELRRRVDRLVAGLAECQAAASRAGFHEGYLSAFPESFIDRVEARQAVWAPWYTLHKILAGLIDAHRLAGSAQARDVAVRMAAWVRSRVDHLTPAQMQASLQTEFGGMNDALAELYALTGDPEHLKLARAFDHAAVFDPLAGGQDALDGLHANTQIPKAIGAAREFELTGERRYQAVARNFWDFVVRRHSYAIGGHSDREHFFPIADFPRHLSPETAETCNTYNLLKLTRHLFSWSPDARQMDFYERALYNHILASQDPARGLFVYLMSLEPGHFKSYSTPENSFWCCVGTGMENHAKYGDTIFARDERGLFVNLFIPATLDWRERGLTLRQESRIPEGDTTRLVFGCRQPTVLALRIRHPGWADGPLAVTINGHAETVRSAPGSYLELSRTWKDGDTVEVRFPLALHTEALPGAADTVALLYGPVVLAGRLGTDGMPSPYVRDQLDEARLPHPTVPVFVTAGGDWLKQVERVSPSPLLFRTRGLGQPQDVTLAPFHTVHHERYTVYWKVLNPAAWQERKAAIEATDAQWTAARQHALDVVLPGDANSEAAHAYHGEGMILTGEVAGRTWRQAQKGGSFAYELQAATSGPASLVCVFGGRDQGRAFEILVDGQKLAEPRLDGQAPGEITVVSYDVPAAAGGAAGGKRAVLFRAAKPWDGATANVFGCALVPKG